MVSSKPKKINIEKIAKIVVGLKVYDIKINDEKMIKYVAFSESHKNPNVSIWAFICGFILMFLNIYGKSIKNDYVEEYAVRKIVESFFNMRSPI
jgi:hypothetical protein